MAPVHPEDTRAGGPGPRVAAARRAESYSDQYRIIGDDGTVRWVSHRARTTVDEHGRTHRAHRLDRGRHRADRGPGAERPPRRDHRVDGGHGRHHRRRDHPARLPEPLGPRGLRAGRRTTSPRSTPPRSTRPRPCATYVDTDPARAAAERDLERRAPDGRTRGGREILVWQTITPTLRADGTLHQISIVGRDVTERRRFEADLAYQATHDSLTGLPNRALLLDHLELALARAERDDRLIALLFLDLDRFKMVNDLHGHDAGDELLAQTARLISEVVRPSDTVARLGGDEFVILCDDVDDEEHAVAVAHRVAAAIESSPYYIGNTNLAISASIGIAMAAGGAGHPEALLRDADAAMYRAKDLGRARLEIYDETMRRRSAHRLELSEQLAEGIELGDIVVRFQPGVDTRHGPGHLRRGPGPLAAPHPRPAGPERVHRPGRGDRPHRRARPARAEHGVRARPPVGGACTVPARRGCTSTSRPASSRRRTCPCWCRACSTGRGSRPASCASRSPRAC